MSVQLNTRIETFMYIYHEQNFDLSAEWHFMASHGKDQQIE
jgi:hypothetical protein